MTVQRGGNHRREELEHVERAWIEAFLSDVNTIVDTFELLVAITATDRRTSTKIENRTSEITHTQEQQP